MKIEKWGTGVNEEKNHKRKKEKKYEFFTIALEIEEWPLKKMFIRTRLKLMIKQMHRTKREKWKK